MIANRAGIWHLLSNSGPATLDDTGQHSRDGKPAMKPSWEIAEKEAQAAFDATTWPLSITEYLPGDGWSSRFLTKGGMPVTMCRINLDKGLGAALQFGHAAVTAPLGDDPQADFFQQNAR